MRGSPPRIWPPDLSGPEALRQPATEPARADFGGATQFSRWSSS